MIRRLTEGIKRLATSNIPLGLKMRQLNRRRDQDLFKKVWLHKELELVEEVPPNGASQLQTDDWLHQIRLIRNLDENEKNDKKNQVNSIIIYK